MPDKFRYYLRVRYAECDAQKVVFNSRYAEYVDIATTEFFRAIGYHQALLTGAFDFQLVKQTIAWKAPARFDQVLEIGVSAKHLGTTSFTLLAEFHIAPDDRIVADCETVYVLVDAGTLQKTPIPDGLRAALERGAPEGVTDHAAYLQTRS